MIFMLSWLPDTCTTGDRYVMTLDTNKIQYINLKSIAEPYAYITMGINGEYYNMAIQLHDYYNICTEYWGTLSIEQAKLMSRWVYHNQTSKSNVINLAKD